MFTQGFIMGLMIVKRERLFDDELVGTLRRRLEVGDKVIDIAKDWGVHVNSIRYWIKQSGIDLKKIKSELKKERAELVKKPKDEKITYYSYLSKAVKQGRMTKQEMRRALGRFYTNRSLPVSTASVSLNPKLLSELE